MKQDDRDLQQLSRLRDTSPAPAVDVAERVIGTIRGLPALKQRGQRWSMAACAAVCAATAAGAVVIALQTSTQSEDSSNPAQFVIDAFEVDAKSLLP